MFWCVVPCCGLACGVVLYDMVPGHILVLILVLSAGSCDGNDHKQKLSEFKVCVRSSISWPSI